MTDIPSQQAMSPEQKAARKQQLDSLNDALDQQLGRSHKTPLFSEAGLSKETKAALDATEQKPVRESKLTYKLPEGMAEKLDNFDAVIKNRPGPKPFMGPVSAEERLRAWHRHLGTPQEIVDYEVAQLKEGKK